MKNIIHDLNKLALKFIELESYSEKKFDADVNILEQFFKRRLLKSYEKKYAEVKKYLEEEKPSDDLYRKKNIFGNIELNYLSFKENIKDILRFDFVSKLQDINLTFFLNCFELNSNMEIYRFHYNKPYDEKFFSYVKNMYLNYDFKNYYSEIQFYCMKCTYRGDNEADYFKLKELFYEHFDKLTKLDQFKISLALIHFCIAKIHRGNSFFVKERFQYHKIMDDNNLFSLEDKTKIKDGYMILNTVIAACSVDEFEWCGKFIERNKVKLEPDTRDKFVNLSYTHLYFKKKDYNKALEYLSGCDNATGMDKINLKTYQIFLYFELGYFEELKNLIDTSRHFIRNDKGISAEVKTLYGRFIEAVNKLNECKYKKANNVEDDFGLSQLKGFISENEMPHKGWLKSKLAELIA